MNKRILALAALVATLCACDKQQPIESEITNPVVEPSAAPLVFTATMESAPETKATFDNAAQSASWEVGDKIAINGSIGQTISAGTSTIFTIINSEVRPTYVSSGNTGCYGNDKASNLVDDAGTSTRWCVGTDQKTAFGSLWNIVVSTDRPTVLKSIKLWNANNTASYPKRIWQDLQVLGRLSSVTNEWTVIKTLPIINLVANNSGLAGEIAINATEFYDEYRLNIFNNKGDDYMQMADMKFMVSYSEIESPYTAYFPETLYNEGQTTLPSEITETWANGTFNMPMYAQSSSTALGFKNLCGVLKITVKNDAIASVKRIHVSSLNKAVSGEFHIDSNNAAILDNPNDNQNSVTINYTKAVKTSSQGTDFYVAIPAQTYQKLKIALDADGKGFTTSMTTKRATDITVERNKIYPIVFADNAQSTTGTAKRTGDIDVNWVQLWEDGPKFAEYNVGAANNRAEDEGGFYCWGKAINLDPSCAYKGGNEALSGDDDTATNLWGSNWRMPTKTELQELLDNCNVEAIRINGMYGLKFTGKFDFASNSIFLPASGCFLNGKAIIFPGMDCYYWSSTPYDDGINAYYLYHEQAYTRRNRVGDDCYRSHGISVRAVLAE